MAGDIEEYAVCTVHTHTMDGQVAQSHQSTEKACHDSARAWLCNKSTPCVSLSVSKASEHKLTSVKIHVSRQTNLFTLESEALLPPGCNRCVSGIDSMYCLLNTTKRRRLDVLAEDASNLSDSLFLSLTAVGDFFLVKYHLCSSLELHICKTSEISMDGIHTWTWGANGAF